MKGFRKESERDKRPRVSDIRIKVNWRLTKGKAKERETKVRGLSPKVDTPASPKDKSGFESKWPPGFNNVTTID